MSTPSLAAGTTEVPLLELTIPACMARTVAAHGAEEALVVRHQGVRWTWRSSTAR